MLLRQQAIFILPLIAALSTTIQCKQQVDRMSLRGNFGDRLPSGIMLNNLFKREIHRTEEAVELRIRRRNGFYADRFTSGTSLNTPFKRALNDDAHEQTDNKERKDFSGTFLINLLHRRKRQFIHETEIPYFSAEKV